MYNEEIEAKEDTLICIDPVSITEFEKILKNHNIDRENFMLPVKGSIAWKVYHFGVKLKLRMVGLNI